MARISADTGSLARMRRLPLALLAVASAACATQPPPDAARPFVADSAAIHAAATAFSAAYVRGDAAAMAALYTEDAVIFPEGAAAIEGKPAIQRYWTLPAGRRITLHRLIPERVEVHGDVASDYGRYEIAGEANGEAWGPSHGKYVVVWKRGADGAWRMYLDMWNRGPAAP